MGFTRLASLPECSRTIEMGRASGVFHPKGGVLCDEVAQGCPASGKVNYGERPRSEARGMRTLEEGSEEEVARKVDEGRSYRVDGPTCGDANATQQERSGS